MTSHAPRSSAGRLTVRRPMRLPPARAPFLDIFRAAPAGGIRRGGVAAHLSYISRKGQLEIETDEGERIGKKGQQALLKDWHLDLSPGQYRKAKNGKPLPRAVKLTHNIVLSMPKPTPPDKVLAAAK